MELLELIFYAGLLLVGVFLYIFCKKSE